MEKISKKRMERGRRILRDGGYWRKVSKAEHKKIIEEKQSEAAQIERDRKENRWGPGKVNDNDSS